MNLDTRLSPADAALICPVDPLTYATARAVIADQLAVSFLQVSEDTDFARLGADSLDHAALMNRLESEFGIAISDDEAEQCLNMRAVLALIGSKRPLSSRQNKRDSIHG